MLNCIDGNINCGRAKPALDAIPDTTAVKRKLSQSSSRPAKIAKHRYQSPCSSRPAIQDVWAKHSDDLIEQSTLSSIGHQHNTLEVDRQLDGDHGTDKINVNGPMSDPASRSSFLPKEEKLSGDLHNGRIYLNHNGEKTDLDDSHVSQTTSVLEAGIAPVRRTILRLRPPKPEARQVESTRAPMRMTATLVRATADTSKKFCLQRRCLQPRDVADH